MGIPFHLARRFRIADELRYCRLLHWIDVFTVSLTGDAMVLLAFFFSAVDKRLLRW